MVQNSQTTTWDVKNPVDNGINYQPQLVIAGFLPSTVVTWIPSIYSYAFSLLLLVGPKNRIWQNSMEVSPRQDAWDCYVTYVNG